jgi:hypothetical protein
MKGGFFRNGINKENWERKRVNGIRGQGKAGCGTGV